MLWKLSYLSSGVVYLVLLQTLDNKPTASGIAVNSPIHILFHYLISFRSYILNYFYIIYLTILAGIVCKPQHFRHAFWNPTENYKKCYN